jgi:hypothetical protein
VAVGKLSQKFVDYRRRDRVDTNCHVCIHRIDNGLAPADCALMEGHVNIFHVCDLFERK